MIDNRDHMLVFQQERHVIDRGPQWRHVRQQRKEFERLVGDVLARGEREGRLGLEDADRALGAARDGQLHGAVVPAARPADPDEIADGYVELLLER